MLLSDEELDSRLSSESNLLNKIRVEVKRADLKQVGDTSIPPMVRNLLANLAVDSDDTQKEIGSAFGVSQATISGYARGLVGDRLDDDIAEVVDTARKSVKEKTAEAHEAALDAMMESLTVLKPLMGKLETAKGASSIAKDMSAIVANLRKGQEDHSTTNNTLVVLHAPQARKESNYEVIDA